MKVSQLTVMMQDDNVYDKSKPITRRREMYLSDFLLELAQRIEALESEVEMLKEAGKE